jgi:GNAT superfamily N-acetyltransferase
MATHYGERTFRKVAAADLPELMDLRAATRENRLTHEELAAMGITVESTMRLLETSHNGWLCEISGRAVGFAMGDRANGEMWVIAMLPEFERMGIGARLLALVEEWLWSQGWSEIWLTTDIDPSLRAYGFYQSQGWSDWKIVDGLQYMRKMRSGK